MRIKPLLTALALTLLVSPTLSDAKPKHCPPGHAKKGWCSPGSVYKLPPGIRMQIYDKWKDHDLRAPRRGERYVIVDNELFLILEATREVLEALGAIDRVLN